MKSAPLGYRGIKEHSVSPKIPKQWTGGKIGAERFAQGLSAFSEEYLVGVMSVSIDGTDVRGCIEISPKSFALLLKLAASHAEGRLVSLEVNLGTEVSILLSYDGARIPPEVLSLLKRTASEAGFDAKAEDGMLKMVADLKGRVPISIRARSANEFFDLLVAYYFYGEEPV